MGSRSRQRRATVVRRRAAAWLSLAVLTLACSRERAPKLPLEAVLPERVAPGTELELGDRMVQKQLELSGGLEGVPFEIGWQNVSGGPQTLEALRASALDGGSVGDTPPIHARFTGLDVKIITVQMRPEPTMQLGVAPGVAVRSLADLRGKKIAYSPGQAQGALVLRVLAKAGLSREQVELVQLTSAEFKEALAHHQVDVAPLGGTNSRRYLSEYGSEGATAIEHGAAEGPSFFYVRTPVLEDPDKAAALRQYASLRVRSLLWSHLHPEEWTEAYYVRDQGLSPEDARYVVGSLGQPEFPRDWSEAIRQTQQTIDLLAQATDREPFDAAELFDRRFEAFGAEAQDQVLRRAELDGRRESVQ